MDSTKTVIKGLLTASPTAMTMQQISKEYRNTIGESIPYTKFGFTSLEQFLRSIPDTVQLQGTGPCALVNLVLSEKSSHVLALVSRQKVDKKKGLRYPLMKRTVVPAPNFFSNYTPPVTRSQTKKIVYPTTKPLQFSVDTVSTVLPCASSKNLVHNTFTSSNNSNGTGIEKETSQCFWNGTTTKQVIKERQEQKPQTLNNNHSKNEENIAKMIENMNISNKAQILNKSHMRRLPKHSDEENIRNADCTSNRTESRASSSMSDKQEIKQSEEYVPVTLKNNLKVLIKKFPDGIWCADLPRVYSQMFKRQIRYHDYGFRSLIDLCTCLKSIFHYVRPSTDDFKLYDRSKPLPATAEQVFTTASYSSSLPTANANTSALPNIDWSDVLLFLPPNVFKPGKEIPRTFIPETTVENDTIEIVIGEVFDVSKFWVYKDDGQLDKLMDDIQSFYTQHAESYRVPRHLIREGLYCVCIIFGEYHRAVVVNAVCEGTDEIRVFYIDYGTIKKEKPELFFLHEHFAKLPAQTIRCRLANIYPPEKGAPWSRQCTEEFRTLIKGRDLTAKIDRINWKDQYLEISLADVTNSENVFYINNVLVEKGHAIFAHQEQKISIVASICTPIVNLIHLFPTFMELEHGLAPSTCEMETYATCNVPLNFCYPQYFFFDQSGEKYIIETLIHFYESRILKGLRQEMHRYFTVDFNKIEEKPIDFSRYMDLEDELKEFWANDNTEEDYAEENACAADITAEDENITNISKKIEMWKTETVKELKKDCELSNDIMKDILSICEFNSETECSSNFIEEELERISEYNGNLSLTDSEYLGIDTNFFEYNVDDLSFSRKNSFNSSIISDDFPSFTPRNEANEPELAETTNEQLLVNFDSKNTSESSKSAVGENCSETDEVNKIPFHPTNPFLSNLLEIEEVEEEIVGNNGQLHRNNPFLQYMSENKEDHSDERSDSSTSTSYAPCIEEVRVKTTWSTIDHRHFDYDVNQFCPPTTLSPSAVNIKEIKDDDMELSENSTVSTSIQTNRSPSPPPKAKSCSVQTGPGFDVNQPEFYPTNYYPTPVPVPYFYPYPYVPPVYPALYSNPHYQQQISRNLHNMLQRGSLPPPSPVNRMAICPPPGFAPHSNLPDAQSNFPDFYEAHNEMLKSRFNS